MKTNNFILTALVVVLGAVSLFFYTSSRNTEFYANQAIKCRETGQEEHEKELEKQTFVTTYFEPQYIYNKSMKTCLYKGGYSSAGGSYYFIKDLYTGFYVAEWSYALTGETITGNPEEYHEAVRELGF
ncbi:hypothetical protein IPJ70_01220 [Candidatus Campbellbacteria bacterium]|nr:MAG: hypothetical protein IPJ70_01220 [Candidatus Campbellbacteria bacterium]